MTSEEMVDRLDDALIAVGQVRDHTRFVSIERALTDLHAQLAQTRDDLRGLSE